MRGGRTPSGGRRSRLDSLSNQAHARGVYLAVMTSSDVQLIQRVRADESGEAMRALYRAYSGEL
jgi:hypothetical protein